MQNKDVCALSDEAYWVDSHCHLNMLDLALFDHKPEQVLAEANAVGVAYFLCVGTNLSDREAVLEWAQRFPSVYASVGLHPAEPCAIEPTREDWLIAAARPKVVAIGETGLDYFHTEVSPEIQKPRFALQIQAGIATQKPLIIHTRNAKQDTMDILRQENADQCRGVMHCFTEDWDTAKKAMDLGFYISFSGIVTFKNAKDLQEIAIKMPLDRMLVETDSPYIAPVPQRGKPNQPAYVHHVGEFIANLRGEPVEMIAKATAQNFFNLFFEG